MRLPHERPTRVGIAAPDPEVLLGRAKRIRAEFVHQRVERDSVAELARDELRMVHSDVDRPALFQGRTSVSAGVAVSRSSTWARAMARPKILMSLGECVRRAINIVSPSATARGL